MWTLESRRFRSVMRARATTRHCPAGRLRGGASAAGRLACAGAAWPSGLDPPTQGGEKCELRPRTTLAQLLLSCATLALLRNSCSLASSARPRLGLRRYRAFVRPGIFSAPSLSSASACPLPSPLRGSGRAYLHPPTLRGRLVGRRVAHCVEVHVVVLPPGTVAATKPKTPQGK